MLICFLLAGWLESEIILNYYLNYFILYFTRLRVSSHRLEIEAGRRSRPNRTPINERLCITC